MVLFLIVGGCRCGGGELRPAEGCGCGGGRVDRVRLLPSHWMGFAHVAHIIQMAMVPCDTWRVTLGYADLEGGIACLGGMHGGL